MVLMLMMLMMLMMAATFKWVSTSVFLSDSPSCEAFEEAFGGPYPGFEGLVKPG